jgi:uncharacterized protein (DUF2252 family)
MAESAHAYVRGSTSQFYEWLKGANRRSVPVGPPVWICGDCHIGNLGPVADAKGRVAVQMRDFDQAVIGNPAHDMVRLGLSLAMAARGSDLPGVTTAKMLEQMVDGYASALAWSGRDDNRHIRKPDSVQFALKEAVRRSWKELLTERIEDTSPKIPLGSRFWPLARRERHAIDQVFGTEKVRKLITSLRCRDDDASVDVLDAAYWMKGCSSLGTRSCGFRVGQEGQHLPDGRQGSRALLCAADSKGRDAQQPRRPSGRSGARHGSLFRGAHARGSDPGPIRLHPRTVAPGSED